MVETGRRTGRPKGDERALLVGVLFPGDEPRDYEAAFFIHDDEMINMGGEVGYGFNARSQIFRSELAAFSYNFMMFLVQASCDGA